jgi:hypothetical protein
LESTIQGEGGSEYAAEGRYAHKLAELYLMNYLNQISDQIFKSKLTAYKLDSFYTPELELFVQGYVDLIVKHFELAKSEDPGAYMLLEQRLDYSKYVPEGFGTGDVVIFWGKTVDIIDLKFGMGVPVSAEDNPQLRLYALGAIEAFSMLYDFEEVGMTIIQPRLDTVSNETLSVNALKAWGENEVKPKALKAYKGEGEYCIGEHCQFCKAKAVCKARADYNLDVLKYEFREPDTLSSDEIAEILTKSVDLQKWVKAVEEYAISRALQGISFNGFKLVEGRSRRKYGNEEAVIKILREKGISDEQIFKPRELTNLSDMEAWLGKKTFKELLGSCIISPPGKADLVPISDKRAELNVANNVKIDLMLG